MAEYIERNKVLEMSYCPTPLNQDNPLADIKAVVDVEDIESIPTADVDEVKWIDVNKRLPDEDGRYLVYRKFGIGNYKNIEVIHFENDSSYYKYVWNREVTHWRPLPEPPKEDGGKEE